MASPPVQSDLVRLPEVMPLSDDGGDGCGVGGDGRGDRIINVEMVTYVNHDTGHDRD